jgi:6-pyruvoyl-tetrahydropterin synthase
VCIWVSRVNIKEDMSFSKFLVKATDANVLARIAREITGDYDDDDLNDEEEKKQPKNVTTHPSPTLEKVLSPFWTIDKTDTCTNGWTCTVAFFKDSLESGEFDFDFSTDEGMAKLRVIFEQLRKLTGAARLSSTSSLGGALVKFNRMIKNRWVKEGFSEKDRDEKRSPIGLAKAILVRTQGEAYRERERDDRAQMDKLNDAYEMQWSDVQTVATKWAENTIGGKRGAVQKLMQFN